MNKNNLFAHGGKEFVMDAFLCWLIKEVNENKELNSLKRKLLETVLSPKNISFSDNLKLSAEKQDRHVDVVVTIENNSQEEKLVFENKMYSTIHNNQLKRYRGIFPEATRFVYWKLGYIHERERNIANFHGYEIYDAKRILSLLDPYKSLHLFINEFCQFIHENFVEPQDQLEIYKTNNKFEELGRASFQQYIMSLILKELELANVGKEFHNFKIGNNPDGRPWTQLDFSQIKNVYGNGVDETLFFRIDKAKGGYYLRVNLYSKNAKEYWASSKKPRLERLKKVAIKALITNELNGNTKFSSAKNEPAVFIIFFKENKSFEHVIRQTPVVAKILHDAHQNLFDS